MHKESTRASMRRKNQNKKRIVSVRHIVNSERTHKKVYVYHHACLLCVVFQPAKYMVVCCMQNKEIRFHEEFAFTWVETQKLLTICIPSFCISLLDLFRSQNSTKQPGGYCMVSCESLWNEMSVLTKTSIHSAQQCSANFLCRFFLLKLGNNAHYRYRYSMYHW